MGKIKNKIAEYLMLTIIGAFIGCSALGIGFAASPQTGDDVFDRVAPEEIWIAVEEQIQQEDWNILVEYMDADIINSVYSPNEPLCEVLQAYCSQDTEFFDIVYDYFG